MIDVKGNFKHMYNGNLQCSLCGECEVQTQEHLLVCEKIVENCQELFDNIFVEHDYIYGTIEKNTKKYWTQ